MPTETHTHYFYRLDPEVAFVEIFLRFDGGTKKTLTGSRLFQIVHDGIRVCLLSIPEPSPYAARFWHEAGKPPLAVPGLEGIYRGQKKEPCIYCGRLGTPIHLLTSWSLPLYQPRGHTCQVCHRTVVVLD